MKDRIKQLIENEGVTPTRFADNLQINRTVISHILNGRNNPSLDVVTTILSEIPYINSDWLLNGKGEMYKDGYKFENRQKEAGLFDENEKYITSGNENATDARETVLKSALNNSHQLDNETEASKIKVAKKIKQIIIYYDDNTFETFVMK